jgi:hypothetical protein
MKHLMIVREEGVAFDDEEYLPESGVACALKTGGICSRLNQRPRPISSASAVKD